MTAKERFRLIMERKSDRCGFWHGYPNPASLDIIYPYFGVKDDFELGLKLGSVFRWVMPERHDLWKNPEHPMFDVLGGKERLSLSQPGVFAGCDSASEVYDFHWPELKDCDLSGTIAEIDRTVKAGQAVASGSWSMFFHVVSDFFGMENYFIKMHTAPEVVDAVTKRVVDFYLELNEAIYDAAGDKIDALFFGNDFGSQLDLLISPECFDRFVMPYFKQLTEQALKRGYYVLLHSCGAIERVIPKLIGAGVTALHPIQARAKNMDAETLAEKYNGKIVFVGGVDTQHLLPFCTAGEVAKEVGRLRGLFGPNFIVSPSHESILPNVPPENIEAMARAANTHNE